MNEHGDHDRYKCDNCNMVTEAHPGTLVLRCGWCGSDRIRSA